MKKAVLIPYLLLAMIRVHAQGCSDAGVCTAGPLGDVSIIGDDGSVGHDLRSDARVLFSYAAGEQGTVITQLVPELNVGIGQRLRLQARVPYMNISGNLGTNEGVGDPTFTAAYAFMADDPRRLELMLGVKLNSNEAAAVATNMRSLPMPYQTSLGTKDLLLGINYREGRFQAGVAYQRVLVNDNRNGFSHLYWMDNADAQGYFESALLDRADDAVLRAQYAFNFAKLVVQPGVLGIYHVGKDEIMQYDQLGERYVQVEGSDGLTLNITADARYPLSDTWAVEASFGAPVIFRDARPDGLTRHYVVNVGVRLAF